LVGQIVMEALATGIQQALKACGLARIGGRHVGRPHIAWSKCLVAR
jgi:hypothetical protein